MRNAGMLKRLRGFSRSRLPLMKSSAMWLCLTLRRNNPDEGMADSPTIDELDDAFLGLNHQDVQNMDGVDDDHVLAGRPQGSVNSWNSIRLSSLFRWLSCKPLRGMLRLNPCG